MTLFRPSLRIFAAHLAVGGVFVACGSLNQGDIVITDADDDDTSSSGKSGTAGSAMNGGSANDGNGGHGADEPVGGTGNIGEQGGEGGEPPVVVSDDPPTVVSVSPADGATNVSPTTEVVVEFSENLDPKTVAGAVTISDGVETIAATVDYSGTKATLTFDARLDLLANYTVTVSTAAKDLAGNALAKAFTSSFKVREGTWGHLVTISNPMGNVAESRYPKPVSDEKGNTLFVWAQTGVANNSPMAIWGRVYSAAKGWQAPFSISNTSSSCNVPSVAMASNGDAVVAWVQREGNYDRVYARRYTAGAWEAKPLRVDGTDATVSRVTAAIAETGDTHVLWQYSSTYMYVAGNVAAKGGAWKTNNQYINGSFDSVSGPVAAFSPDGNGFVAWALKSGMTTEVRVERYLPATGWGNLTIIPGSTTAQVGYNGTPALAADATGGAMLLWRKTADLAATRFTKAAGWSAVVAVDGASSGSLNDWTPSLVSHGDDFVTMWEQAVGNVSNIFTNRYTAGAWASPPTLLSDGDTSVHEWSENGFALDRQGNGMAVWVQGSDVRFSRFVANDKKWSKDAPLQTLDTVMEAMSSVAPNGMSSAVYCTGYPYYENHQAIYGAIFE